MKIKKRWIAGTMSALLIGGIWSARHFNREIRDWEVFDVIETATVMFMPNTEIRPYFVWNRVVSPYGIQSNSLQRQGRFGYFTEHLLIRHLGRSQNELGVLRTDFRFGEFEGFQMPRNLSFLEMWYPLSEWESDPFKVLRQLPEQTMVEAQIQFGDFMSMEEVFDIFRDTSISLEWLAIHSGSVQMDEDGEWYVEDGHSHRAIIGMPHYRGARNFRSRLSSIGRFDAFDIPEPYGDIRLREQIFLSDLELLARHEDIVEIFQIHTFLRSHTGIVDFDSILTHVRKYGIQVPGVVVTAPTSELLELEGEPWISWVTVTEVDFLQWWLD